MYSLLYFLDLNAGRARVIKQPKDAVSNLGQEVRFNCTVEDMTAQDNLIWWHRPFGSQRATKLFESNPSGSAVSSQFVEVVGTYDIIVRNVSLEHSGEFMCQLVKMQNYTAQLTVVGE